MHREHKFLKGKLESVVLRDHEPKMAFRQTRSERIRTRLLDQVEGPRVGSGDLPVFRQNHSDQDADIASFRQRHADAVQFLHVALGSLEFRARGALALGHLDVFKRRVDGLAHQLRSCLIGKSGEATGGVLAIGAVS